MEFYLPKTIVIFCRHIDKDKQPFNSSYYWHAYTDLLLALKTLGANAYFATSSTSYRGKGLFSLAYTCDRKVPVQQFQTVHNVAADIVYDKGGFKRVEDTNVLNPQFVHSITADKAQTYEHFREYQPASIKCTNESQLSAAVQSLKGDLVVVKTPVGNGGHGVYIGTKNTILHRIPSAFPLLVQEFLDTSVGIDGFVNGIHDLRVKIGGGEIFGGTLRTPAPGEYRANVAQGGTEKHLLPSEIPQEAIRIARKIDRYFAGYPRYYAIDLAHTTQG